ncbi:hypothetical protein A1O3_01490 [Capronia epimyces CBS 606.96]|uniref:Large ribosomal subunit protein mL46 n=1 Tax=Capronia epimyces CBS 606.96 TaxID=1182542 RepID=W9ZEL5_9EURO|nr:uncharacterized protein A1O3_01490 [Capronia epimyces CBS 606.96]EXJ92934.1 hypothetical protein A1O3_01490 [Capronia epimyces CBS 606.96]
MAPRSRGAKRIADALGFSTPNNHVCLSCRQALALSRPQRGYASAAATAKSTVEAPPITQLSSAGLGPEASPHPKSSFTIKAGVVLSRPPLITPDPHPFETAYYLYQRRLNERLALPFTQYFYYKRGTPAFEQWRKNRQERGGAAARDIGKYNAYTPDAWNDEVLVGDETGSPAKLVEKLVAEENRADEFTGNGDPKFAGLKRRTDADEQNDQRSLERSLSRTLYLLVKHKKVPGQSQEESELWKFPSGTLLGHEGLKQAAQRILFTSLGENMNTFFVGNHPVGHYVARFASPKPGPIPPTPTQKSIESESTLRKQEMAQAPEQHPTLVDGEKTFFMKARILAGQADLQANQAKDIEDFRWLSKDEIEKAVHPDYWVKVKNMLGTQ